MPRAEEILSLNHALTDKIALYVETAQPPGVADPRQEGARRRREAEAEAEVDALTERIRAHPATTLAELAVKLRALLWDLGFAHRLLAPARQDDFETACARRMLAEVENLLALGSA